MQFSRPRILIIDDNPENLAALHTVLDSPDFEIIDALSGPEALTETLSGDFNLILLAVQMPQMDGYETASSIRSHPESLSTPIIFISAIYLDEASTIKGYELGGVDFITKPFSPETLKKKVEFFVKLVPQIRSDQHSRDIVAIYEKFRLHFDKIVDPLWYLLLDVQILKRLSNMDREKMMSILDRNLDKLESSIHDLNALLSGYLNELESESEQHHQPAGSHFDNQNLSQTSIISRSTEIP